MMFLDTTSHTLLTSILEGTSEPICALDHDFRLIASNQAHREEFEAVFGVVPELGEPLDMSLDHLPEELELGLELWRRALEGEEFTVTAEFGMPEGVRRVYELTFRRMCEDGRQVGAVQFARDITEMRANERAKRRSEERFRQLADAMPQLVWSADADGVVDYYNERAEEYAGIERGASDQWKWAPTVHPDDRQATIDAWADAVENERLYEIEHRVQLADGSYRWHLSRSMPTRDEQGHVVRWYGTATDIEETKRAEMELRQADHRKNEFLAMLGHELRNPLAAIANGIRVIKRGGANGREALPMVQRHVDQMTRLLDDLLDISRITRGKLRVERKVRPLRPLVAAAVNAVRPWIDQFGHQLDVQPIPEVAVNADATRLEQIVSNLLDNAATYTPPGGHIQVWVEVDDDRLSIHVRDNGRGIAPAESEAIFEPFAQTDSGEGRGLGIGLALVRQLVALHDGTIQVTSEGRGHGSEFIVELPRAPEELIESTEPRDDLAPRLDGLRVLAIDDNIDASRFMALLLTDAGCHVETAATGEEGLRLADEADFDVVLLDIGLPDMNGREVARQLRAKPAYANACLIAVSGYNQDSDVLASEEAGFDAHLGKPISPEMLRAAIAGEDVREAASRPASMSRHSSPISVDALSPQAASNEALVALIRQLSHDLRSPLSAVKFSATLLAHYSLANRGDGDRLGDMGARLLRASNSMTKMTDEAYDLACAEVRGDAALQREMCTARELSDAVCEELAGRQLEWVSVVLGAEESSSGLWDRGRLRRVIADLAELAAETAGDPPTVHIDQTDTFIRVELDLHIEVPPLERVHQQTDNFDSLHMKLRYADVLLRAHQGHITLVHGDGRGTVRLWLPRN